MGRVRHTVLEPAERVLDQVAGPAVGRAVRPADRVVAQLVEVTGVGEPPCELRADRVRAGRVQPPVRQRGVERRVRAPRVAGGDRRALDRVQEPLDRWCACHRRLPRAGSRPSLDRGHRARGGLQSGCSPRRSVPARRLACQKSSDPPAPVPGRPRSERAGRAPPGAPAPACGSTPGPPSPPGTEAGPCTGAAPIWRPWSPSP